MSKEPRPAWFALWILFGINAMNFYDRQILAAVAEPIRKEWALSDTALGTLATAFTLIYATVGLPLGRLADSWSRGKLLGLGVATWSVLTAASGLAWSYASLFVSRLGVGIGEKTIYIYLPKSALEARSRPGWVGCKCQHRTMLLCAHPSTS